MTAQTPTGIDDAGTLHTYRYPYGDDRAVRDCDQMRSTNLESGTGPSCGECKRKVGAR